MKGIYDGGGGKELALTRHALAAQAKSTASPVKAVKERDVYYPGSEDLASDEMRIVALGTGMPSARPKQAAACWLVELGNGDKFIFDIGSGCHERLAAQKIPYDYLDKVFLGHLHVDHMGDLPTFWLGGTVMNRLTPLRIWGPSGGTPEYGTKHALDLMEKMYVWDIATRSGVIDFRGGKLDVTEFAFDGVNKVIYNENGVVIRSIPAVHGLDGAVSFILEWNGLKFVYGSDTIPNKWYVEHAKGADVAVHECFLPPTLLITKQGFTPLEALNVGTQGHTSPEQFGKVMSLVKPRLAVGYHFYNDFDQPAGGGLLAGRTGQRRQVPLRPGDRVRGAVVRFENSLGLPQQGVHQPLAHRPLWRFRRRLRGRLGRWPQYAVPRLGTERR